MKAIIVTALMFSWIANSQSLDFGVEVNSNFNSVEKFDFGEDLYDSSNLSMSIVDLAGNTSDIYFHKFTMDNHFEIPLYFRYNLRKRWFFDFKLSNSVNKLQMWGSSNYNDQNYQDNFGTYDEFIIAANNDGFNNADSSDYESYISNARKLNESSVRTSEEFKLLSFTANAGFRFFPHKSVKMFLAAGFTYKAKYAKHVYSNVSFGRDYIENVSSVEKAIDRYAETSSYFNAQLGVEFYRFRMSAFFQTGMTYSFSPRDPGPEVTYTALATPFDVIRTYGFSLSANLFSLDLGKRVKRDDVSEDDLIISNIESKKEKWDLGIRYDRRGYNDLTTFYGSPESQLSVLKQDSTLYNNWGTFVEGQQVELITLGGIKRVKWGGRISGFMNFYFTRRFGVRASLGGSRMVFDVESRELNATIIGNDSTGYSYLIAPGTPRLKSAVYRKTVDVIDLSIAATYKIIDRDLFSLGVNIGFGFSGMAYVPADKRGAPEGVNELSVYSDLDDFYSGEPGTGIQFHQGELDVDLNGDPKAMLDKFNEGVVGLDESEGATLRLLYPTVSFGLEANLERYTIGIGGDFSLAYMDEFLLDRSKSVYMSVAYKLFKR